MKAFPKRGEIYWVKLDPTIGSESKKTRPGLIISNDVGNEVSDRVMVAPISSQVKKVYPFESLIKTESIEGKVMLDQTRSIDKQRLGHKMGHLTEEQMKHVDRALKLVLGLD